MQVGSRSGGRRFCVRRLGFGGWMNDEVEKDMNWTNETPKKTGFYYWQGGNLKGKEVAVVQVTAFVDKNRPLQAEELCTTRPSGMAFKNAPLTGPAEAWGGMWAGPLPEPDKTELNNCPSDVVSVLRQNGIDCSDLIGGDTVHIFNSRTTEQNLRDMLGAKVRKFKPGVYGTFNPHYNKSIFCEIEVCDESNTGREAR